MKEKEYFKKLSEQKVNFSLRTKLTLFIGAIVFFSILISHILITLSESFLPFVEIIPRWIQLNILSLAVAIISTHYLSKIFFDPIKILSEGMKKIADGDFDVRLSTKSSSLEIQEIFAGFNMMAKELSSTEILQSDFVSNVSHEFKTPINAIEGYTTLLQSTENIDETENWYIEKILFNTKRLSSLVSNILLLSKIENQTIRSHNNPYRLDEQIRESIVSLEYSWEPKEIELDIELDDIEYNGNELMMRHVWNNLIGNAIKFSPAKDTIKIRLLNQSSKYVFVIENNGPELSSETLKHLFDKFYQADTSHKEEGNGLGLTLAKRILAIECGEISAENIPGGCRFTVTLRANK